MLKGIPAIISPELLKTLAEMGHGDKICLGDAYFAAATMAKENKLIRADGVSSVELTDAILNLMPLDTWVEGSVTILGKPDPNGGLPGMLTDAFTETVKKHDEKAAETIRYVDRFEFYDLAKESFAVVACGLENNFGCIILQKGVL